MPKGPSDFSVLMNRVRGGSPEAAAELVERYEPVIQHVVREKLHPKLRSKYDSLDFMQSVWASFFTREVHRAEFAEPKKLVAFLSRLARRKVVDAFRRRLQTIKHDVDGEHSLESTFVFKRPWCLWSDDPSPSQVAVAAEEWDRILADQPPLYRAIFVLLRRGRTHEQIATKLGLSEKTVRRVVRRVQMRLQT
jgi:RNA polymerase sigma-70 factor (ECF subfamily)